MKTLDAKRVLEAALICSSQPMALRDMSALFAGEVGNDTLRGLLEELADDCKGRAIELVAVATGWRYQSRAELAPYLARLDPERPPKYSRAVLETLAIIAYRQPVTRGDIEDIRGVTVSTPVVKQLEDRGWVEAIGYRETPGRPALYATTKQFLDDLGLASLEQLPLLEAAGTPMTALAEALADQPSLLSDGVAAAEAQLLPTAGAEAALVEAEPDTRVELPPETSPSFEPAAADALPESPATAAPADSEAPLEREA